MRQKFFDTLFGASGDLTTVPDSVQVSGAISFAQGWGVNYQRQIGVDPLAMPIDRATMNYLFNAITGAIQQYQSFGSPEWITSANNGGTPFAYDYGVIVRYSASGTPPFQNYVSVLPGTATNTSTPGADGNWLPFNPTQTSALIALTNANVTLSAVQYAANVIILTGTLTGNVNMIFPNMVGQWLLVNRCTGAFTVTAKTAAGTGYLIPNGANATLYGDATNIDLANEVAPISALTDPAFADNTSKSVSSSWVYGAMSAIATAAGFAASFTTNGYIKFPSWLGGFVMQWGTVAINTTVTSYNFPIAFPNAVLGMSAITNTAASQVAAAPVSVSQYSAQSVSGTPNLQYIAVGR